MPNPTIKKKQKKNPYKQNLLLGGTLLGGGLGSLALSRGVLTPQDHGNLSTFSNFAQNNWTKGQDPRESLKQYIEYGHRSIAAKPFGIDAVGVMKGLRSPTVLNTVGNAAERVGLSSLGSTIKSQAMPEGGLEHYIQFSKSPLHAYRRLMYEHVNGHHGASAGTEQNLEGLLKSKWFGRPGDTQVDNFLRWNKNQVDPSKLDWNGLEQQRNSVKGLLNDTQPKFRIPFLNNFKPTKYVKGYDAHGKHILNPEDGKHFMQRFDFHVQNLAKQRNIDLLKATVDQKRQIYQNMDGYVKNVDPAFWKQKQYNDYSMGTLMPNAGPMYSKVIAPFTGARDALKYTGIAAAAAGAGIGGYALYKMLRAHLDSKKKKRAVQVLPPVQNY